MDIQQSGNYSLQIMQAQYTNIRVPESLKQTGALQGRNQGLNMTVMKASQYKIDMTDFQMEIQVFSKRTLQMQGEMAHVANESPVDLSKLVFNGKPISLFSQDEAKALISEDGHFGVRKTSDRILEFVDALAGDDLNKLQSGREGILKGFKEAEKMWGSQLPQISYDTLNRTLEKIDKKISDLGGSIVDIAS